MFSLHDTSVTLAAVRAVWISMSSTRFRAKRSTLCTIR